jgi:hypothetical protein
MAAVLALAAVVPSPAAGDDGDKVVVSRPGVVFHAVGSGDLRGRGFEKTRDEALTSGYSPCPICFASKIAAATPTSGLSARVAATSAGGRVGLPPHLIPAPVAQPFGLRCFPSRGGSSTRSAVKNPYREPETIRNPGMEQGAYSESW